MNWWGTWSVFAKLGAVIVVALTAIVSAASVKAVVEEDGWVPASRGWVRTWAATPIAERNALIAQVQNQTNERLDALQGEVRSLSLGQLQTRIDAVDLRLLILQQELTMLNIRANLNPDDTLVANRKTVVEGLIRRSEEDLRSLNCELSRRNNPGLVRSC